MRLSLLGLTVLVTLLGCGSPTYISTLEKVRGEGEIVVGTEPEFPPFESRNERGELVGFDIDLAKEIAKDLGIALRFEAMAFDSLPAALDSGRIDLILSGMTATKERALTREFTEPYFRTQLCLLVGHDSGIERPEQVGSRRLVVKLGTTGDLNAAKLFPDATVTKFDTEGACALEVIHGRADAFLYDRHAIQRHHEANPKTTRAILEPLSDEPYAMAARLGDKAFVAWLNDFLRQIRDDGRYDALYRKHFGTAPPEHW